MRRSQESEQERPRLRGRGAGRGKGWARGGPDSGWGSDSPYCTRSDYSASASLGPGGGAWAGVLPGPRMCQCGRADVSSFLGDVSTSARNVSTLAGDVSSFRGDVFSFPANVFTFRPNVFSFPGDVFSFRGQVFSCRRRAASRYGRLRADEHPHCVRSFGVGRQGILRPRAPTLPSKASRGRGWRMLAMTSMPAMPAMQSVLALLAGVWFDSGRRGRRLGSPRTRNWPSPARTATAHASNPRWV